eukprot:15444114-Alexandrium_andersonii.AAC.1
MISTALANQVSTALPRAYARRHCSHSGEPCLRRPRCARPTMPTLPRGQRSSPCGIPKTSPECL